MNVKQICAVLAEPFETRKRDSGEAFTVCKDDAPEWVRDVARAAHGDMLPDDTKYGMIHESAEKLTEYADNDSTVDSLRDQIGEMADSMVDIYHADRVRWLASDFRRAFYIDEAREEGLIGPDTSTLDQIGIGQYQEYCEILNHLLSAIEDQEGE